ncbi:antichymotrypsin-2-like isoform X2 [Galleria mellonella]|uniref:Antichymotrypsin-2-like isoform X2 n=1 Tax=Galleria mellonella TaxID=7137 RepID=A0A6J3CDG0_GALME|nr:antichymotrypsin-2-like isoform X2 [Galleria mellonella]
MFIKFNLIVKIVLLCIKIEKMNTTAYDISYFKPFGQWPGLYRPLQSVRKQQSIPYRCYVPMHWTDCIITPKDIVIDTSYLNTKIGLQQPRNKQLNGLIYQNDRNFNMVGNLQPLLPVYDKSSLPARPMESVHSLIPINGRKSFDANKNNLLLSLKPSNTSVELYTNSDIIKPSNMPIVLGPIAKPLVQLPTGVISNDTNKQTANKQGNKLLLLDKFKEALEKLELKFYMTTFTKLSSSGSEGRRENGISFVQSALFLQLHLMAISTEVDNITKAEIDDCIGLHISDAVEEDSKGAMHDTFEEEEFSEGLRALAMNTLYLRGRWRSAPTVLNGSWPFRDADGAPRRTVRMIRINDIMRYGDLTECNAEAIEVAYATPGLTLLILVPRGRSLRKLASHVVANTLHDITEKMTTMRVAATLPLYTLRMTLLLPSKLQTMGISGLFNTNITDNGQLRLSHGVQRLMFWAEAGRNAFKDDGIEWEETPEYEMVVDRPYMFFVRWHNMTLLNGNFVL